MLLHFLEEWTGITSNRFVLNMVQRHHLQLRLCPPFFHNFWQFSVKVTAAHHPIIQKVVDELLSKGAIEPSSGGAGFYSSVFVVLKCTGGLWSILNLKQFNCYLHIPSFKIPTIGHVWQLIQHGDYAFCIDLQDAYLHVPIVKQQHHFYDLFGMICHISVRFYLLDWPQPLGFSQSSLNLSCSFAITRFSILLFIWMTSWSWFTLRGLTHFCVLYWFASGCILNFPSLTIALHKIFVSWGYVGVLSICQYLCLLIS